MLAPIDKKFPPVLTKCIPQDFRDQIAFDAKDGDGNGELSRDEYVSTKGTGLKEKLERYRQHAEFERYDANGDGKLSEKEFKAGRQRDRKLDGIKTGPWNGPFNNPFGGIGSKLGEGVEKLKNIPTEWLMAGIGKKN